MTQSSYNPAWPEAWREQTDAAAAQWIRRVLTVGMAWLVIGMAVMPAGVSYNPSKAYQSVLALTMWLPALVLVAMRPRRLLEFCKLPLMPWVIALLAWGWISLAWSHAPHRGDEAARNLSVLLFLIASQWVASLWPLQASANPPSICAVPSARSPRSATAGKAGRTIACARISHIR